jgi:hypothetical protein
LSKTREGCWRRWALKGCTVSAMCSLVALGCSSAYMKSYSSESKLAPSGAFGCVADVVTELGYQIQDSVRADGTLKAETQKPTVMTMDGRALIYHVSVAVSKEANSANSMIEVTTNNESHARIILRTCSRIEEDKEEEKQDKKQGEKEAGRTATPDTTN